MVIGDNKNTPDYLSMGGDASSLFLWAFKILDNQNLFPYVMRCENRKPRGKEWRGLARLLKNEQETLIRE